MASRPALYALVLSALSGAAFAAVFGMLSHDWGQAALAGLANASVSFVLYFFVLRRRARGEENWPTK